MKELKSVTFEELKEMISSIKDYEKLKTIALLLGELWEAKKIYENGKITKSKKWTNKEILKDIIKMTEALIKAKNTKVIIGDFNYYKREEK